MTYFSRNFFKVFSLSVAAALMVAGSALAAGSGQAAAVGATTGSSLRLREEPSTEADVVTMLDKSVAVAVLDASLDGWYQVSYNGKTGYVSADYLVIDQDNVFESYGRVNSTGVNVRSGASTDTAVVTALSTGDIVSVTAFENGWYAVSCDAGQGYIRSDFLDLTSSTAPASSGNASGVVATAMQYLGTRYAYGGASPSGFDCSGFTMYVFKKNGVSLPHSATSQWQSGIGSQIYSISELQPGDLVFFNDPSRNAGKACSHAGIYIGGGEFIHSSSSRSKGVVISDLTSGYYNNYFVGGMRV